MLHHKFDIRKRDREGIYILDLHGHLIMGGGDIALRDFVQSLFDDGNRQLSMNLAAVAEIDTSGLGVLLFLAEQHRQVGGKIVLFNIAHAHGKVYEMARLEAAIEIYRDELDAINSFFPDRKTTRYDILEYVENQVHHENKSDQT